MYNNPAFNIIISYEGLFYFQIIFKMTSLKYISIPAIPNFANLIVYPSEQKVCRIGTDIGFITVYTKMPEFVKSLSCHLFLGKVYHKEK